MFVIDLNCDMGEAFGNYTMPNDLLLMDYISSANIACGFHAGDPAVMESTVKAAIKKGVAIGAHPGLADLQGFGRREMKISAREAYQLVLFQVGALYAFVKAAGGRLNHVKAHGALYNMAARDAVLAAAISEAVRDFDPSLILFGLANSEMIAAAKNAGLAYASEVFADRTYQDDGSLTPRSKPDALITLEQQSLQQASMMVMQQQVVSVNNRIIPLKADTVCLHSDGANAVVFAKNIRESFLKEGIIIKPPHFF
jgi:UPF0271 protein